MLSAIHIRVADAVGCHDTPANQGASVSIRIEPIPIPSPDEPEI